MKGIKSHKNLLHWNYFIALESDLDQISRFIEFDRKNFSTYSIELAHLLLAASSETDVVAKVLCRKLDATKKPGRISDYQKIIPKRIPEFCDSRILCPKYDLVFTPWRNWKPKRSPDWWSSYNKVKHQRNEHFRDANLKNALNALAGLMVTVSFYYQCELGIYQHSQLVGYLTTRGETDALSLGFCSKWAL